MRSVPARRRSDGAGLRSVLWLVGTAFATAWAYRAVVSFAPRQDLSHELEVWLLMPSETSAAVVVLLAGWLLYRRRHRLAVLEPTPGPVWLTALLFVVGFAIYAWATYTAAADLLVFSLMANLMAVGNLFWGPPGLRVLIVPVAFLIFAVPMPAALVNAIVFRFQLWTADLTGLLTYLIGLPTFVAGDQIFREGDTFTVVEGCSGMRSVETLTMLSVLMIDLFRRRGWHAAILLLAAPPVAFLLNGWRAVFLMLNPLSGTAAIHNAQGIAVLMGGVVLLFLFDGLLGRFFQERPPPRSARGGLRGRLSPARALGATAAFAGLAVVSHGLPVWEPPPRPPLGLATRIPTELGDWESTELETDYVFLGRVGFAETVERRYRRGPEAVDLFVGVSDHRNRMRAGLSPKTLRPGSGWIVEEAGRVPLEAVGRTVDFRVLRSGTHRILVYHWREGDTGLAGEVLWSLLALDQSPLHRSRHMAVFRVTTPLGGSGSHAREAAEERLAAFTEELMRASSPLGTAGKRFPVFYKLGKDFPPARPDDASQHEQNQSLGLPGPLGTPFAHLGKRAADCPGQRRSCRRGTEGKQGVQDG